MWPQFPLRDQQAACSGARAKQPRRLRIRRYTNRLQPHLEGLEGRLLLAAGDLDPGFGIGGKVMTDFAGPTRNSGEGVAVQADGKLVVVGGIGVARYNTDGSLDTTFGTGGRVTVGIIGGGTGLYAVAVQSDGKVVAAGGASNAGTRQDFCLMRLNGDGSLDTTFGAGGEVTTDVGSGDDDFGHAVAIQPDGKIVAAGSSGLLCRHGTDFALVRYNADGSLDTTFGTGGKVTTDFFGIGKSDYACGVALQTDGKIVAAGLPAPPTATRISPWYGTTPTGASTPPSAPAARSRLPSAPAATWPLASRSRATARSSRRASWSSHQR